MITNITEAVAAICKSESQIFLACTGGGSGLQDMLWSVPGASSYLAGAIFPYSTHEFDSFIGYQKKTNYCSLDASVELAMASYIRAREHCIVTGKKNPIGLGLSSACTTNRERRGKNNIFVATVSQWGVHTGFVTWDARFGEESARQDDGRFTDLIGLSAILNAIGAPEFSIDLSDPIISNLSGNIKYLPQFNYLEMKECPPKQVRELFFQRPFYAETTKDKIMTANMIFMPGSFNPIHDGHRDIVWKTTMEAHKHIAFMVTADSVHKKSLSVPEMLDRVAMIRLERFGNYPGATVLFTQNDPLFIDKARKYPNASFLIGWDTAARMLDPVWGPEIIPMLHEFRKLGTKFYVCGRIVDGVLRTIKDLNYPPMFSDLFIEVPNTGTEHSSTALRAQLEKVPENAQT